MTKKFKLKAFLEGGLMISEEELTHYKKIYEVYKDEPIGQIALKLIENCALQNLQIKKMKSCLESIKGYLSRKKQPGFDFDQNYVFDRMMADPYIFRTRAEQCLKEIEEGNFEIKYHLW